MGGCGRVYGVSGKVFWGVGEVKGDVGGDEERFGVWDPNTFLPFPTSPPTFSPFLTSPLKGPYLPPHLNTLSYTYPPISLTFSKCGEGTTRQSFWQP